MNHIAKPTELRDEYEEMIDDLTPILEPYLPESIRILAFERARRYGQRIGDYAEIDQLIGAVRRNGLPDSKKHRVYQLVVDHEKSRQARNGGEAA